MLVSRLSELQISKMSLASSDAFNNEHNDDSSLAPSSSISNSSSKSSKRRLKKLKPKNPFKKASKSTPQPDNESANNLHMKIFFENIQTIQENVQSVAKATENIHKLHKDVMTCVSVEKEKNISDKLQKQVVETNKTIKVTIALLQQLQYDATKMAKPSMTDTEEKEVYACKNVIAATFKQLKDEAGKYREAQEIYKLDLETKMKRQIQIVDPSITQETMDTMISNGDDVETLIQQKVLQNKVNSEIRTTCFKITSKCQDVLALETSVRQLHQMFLDMALLTELQGQQLDKIEFHVREGVETTEKGNENLVEAIKSQKKIRKKQMFILVIAAVAVVILIVILV